MRAFNFLLVPTFLVSISHAIAIDKRVISNPVQICVDDMLNINPQVDVLNAAVETFNHTGGYTGAMAAHTKEQELEKRIKQAANTCCVTSPNTYTAEETDSVLAAVGISTPKYVNLFDNLIIQKPEFDQILLWTGLFRANIKNIGNHTDTLNNCLFSKTPTSPPSYRETANAHFNQLKSSVNDAYDKFVKNTTTTPTISPSVKLCIDDMSNIDPQIDVLNADVKQFVHTSGYTGALSVHSKEQELEKRIKKAADTCCVTSPNTFNVPETDAILNTVGTSTPKYINMLDSFIIKKPEFDQILLWTGLLQTDFKNIGNQTNTLNTCLLAKTPAFPPNYKETATGYFTQLKSGIDMAVAKYVKVNATTTPTSPAPTPA